MIFKATETLGGAPVILWVKHHGTMKSLAHQVEVQRFHIQGVSKVRSHFFFTKISLIIKDNFCKPKHVIHYSFDIGHLKY